jgi:hypothetical protein
MTSALLDAMSRTASRIDGDGLGGTLWSVTINGFRSSSRNGRRWSSYTPSFQTPYSPNSCWRFTTSTFDSFSRAAAARYDSGSRCRMRLLTSGPYARALFGSSIATTEQRTVGSAALTAAITSAVKVAIPQRRGMEEETNAIRMLTMLGVSRRLLVSATGASAGLSPPARGRPRPGQAPRSRGSGRHG